MTGRIFVTIPPICIRSAPARSASSSGSVAISYAWSAFAEYWKPGQPTWTVSSGGSIPDGQSRRLAIETGQAMMSTATDIEPFDVPGLRAAPNLNVTTKGWEYFSPLFWYEPNHRVAPFGDKRVRQAMSMAVDRDFVVQHLWFGLGKAATGPVASTTRFYNAAAKMPAFDVAAANNAARRGRSEAQRARRRAPPSSTSSAPYGEVWSRMGEYFRQAMHQIGFEVTLETTDAGTWASRLANWDYETTSNVLYQYGDPTLGVERSVRLQ